MKREATKTFKNVESRVEAQVSKFNSYATNVKLLTILTYFILLEKSAVDISQSISVVTAYSIRDTI